jgi:hypothetical protein
MKNKTTREEAQRNAIVGNADDVLAHSKLAVYVSIALLATLGVFGDLHPPYNELLPSERRHISILVTRGEPRPDNYTTVELPKRWPSTDYLAWLVKDMGYCSSAAWGAVYHVAPTNDRRAVTLNEVLGDSSADDWQANRSTTLHPEHPYIPASPQSRNTTVGGNFHAETVTRAIAEVLPGISDAHARGLFDILTKRRPAVKVAEALGVKVGTMYSYKYRLMVSIRERGCVVGEFPKEKDRIAA